MGYDSCLVRATPTPQAVVRKNVVEHQLVY
jgi:hypothetical protein